MRKQSECAGVGGTSLQVEFKSTRILNSTAADVAAAQEWTGAVKFIVTGVESSSL